MSATRKKMTGSKNPRSRKYRVTSPDGKVFIIIGAFDKYCKANDIRGAHALRKVAQGKKEDYYG